jgi:hypothetical protein
VGTSALSVSEDTGRESGMARRPNYGFEKRQKEIAKQKKKEEKAEKKRLKKEGGGEEENSVEQSGGEEEGIGVFGGS